MSDQKDVAESQRAVRKVALIMGAFFVVFIVVDALFVTLALRTYRGVVVENAYEKGLHYNDVIHAARDADAPPDTQ